MPDLICLFNPANWFWQWMNLLTGVVGLMLTWWAWQQAISAKKAAEDASRASTHLAQEYLMTELLADMLEFQQLAGPLPAWKLVADRASRLRGRIRELRHRVIPDKHQKTVLEKLDLIAEALATIVKESVNSKTQPATKLERIAPTISTAISDLSDVLGLKRSERKGNSNVD